MLVKDFIKQYPGASFDMMTPGGFVFLTAQQAKDLLAGKAVMAHPGDPACAVKLDADELLRELVESARWEKQVCHMLTGYPQEEMQADCQKEVDGGMEREKEQKLRERLKAGYEAYIQQLKEKPVPDLIEMASEIAAAKFVYEELMVEGAFSEYTDYLLQFENPLEVLKDQWLSEQTYDHHEELDHALWMMANRGIGTGEYPMIEESSAVSSLEQGVAMC